MIFDAVHGAIVDAQKRTEMRRIMMRDSIDRSALAHEQTKSAFARRGRRIG
jgi:hypothetical protein